MDVLFQEANSAFESTTDPAGSAAWTHHEVEAPDQGDLDEEREAPETCAGRRHPEAPDAGEGRTRLWEHEFTHGRSQS